VPLRLSWLLQKKITNNRALTKYQQNRLKQKIEQFAVRFINLLSGIRRNCLRSGRSDKNRFYYFRGISILPAMYKISSKILLSRLTPYAEKMIGDHQCGFRRNKSITDHIFRIRKCLRKEGNTRTRKQRISS